MLVTRWKFGHSSLIDCNKCLCMMNALLLAASQSTLDAFPQMQELTNCSLITNPIGTMVRERCGPAKVAINRIWICFAVMSSIMVLLIIFWCLANRRNTQQRYNTSITPQDQSFTGARPPYNVMPKWVMPVFSMPPKWWIYAHFFLL